MNMMLRKKMNLVAVLTSSLLLQNCGGGGGGDGGSPGSAPTSKFSRQYEITKAGVTNWFGDHWGYIDGVVKAGDPFTNITQNSPSQNTSNDLAALVLIKSYNDTDPSHLIMQKSDGSSFDEKFNGLQIDKGSSVTMDGTPDSKLQVDIFYIQGEMTVKSGNFIVTNSAIIAESGVLKSESSDGNNIIFRGDAAKKDTNRIDLSGRIDANLTVPESFTLAPGEKGIIGGDLITNGRLNLNIGSTLKLEKSYTNTGSIYVYLGNDPAVATPLLTAKGKVDLKGTLKVVDGRAGDTYTLLTSDDSIINNLTVDGGSTLSLADPKTLKVTVVTPVAYMAPSNANTFFCGLEGFSHDFKTFLNTHQNVVNAASWQKDRKMFYALSWTNFGVYGELDDLNGFSGAVYGVSSAFGLKWTNFVHAGANVVASSSASFDAKHYFMNATSQISRSFGSKGLMISPKISAAFERIFGANGRLFDGGHVFHLSVEKENAFLVEGGVDVSSHFNIKSLPFQVFASAQIVNSTGHGLTLHGPKTLRESNEVKREFTFGVKATLSHASTAYVNTTFAQNVQTFGIGLDVRI